MSVKRDVSVRFPAQSELCSKYMFETLALNISELPEDLSTSQANFHNSRVPGGVLKLYRSKLF